LWFLLCAVILNSPEGVRFGLYDEAMPKKHYGYPKKPELEDARRLYE